MMYKAGLVSYYGGSLMNNWGEYVEINEYTKKALDNTFFNPKDSYEISPSKYCSYVDKKVYWNTDNIDTKREVEKDTNGYEVLQGNGIVHGKLLGGCIETFIYLIGTPLWPTLDDGKIKYYLLK